MSMKTAEEWLQQAASTSPASIADTGCEQNEACICERCKHGREVLLLPADIRQIQIDALREAAELIKPPMRRESEYEQYKQHDQISQECADTILAFSEQLAKKDL